MVWDERRPLPLTADKVEAVLKGRDAVASFKLPGLMIFCWHFAVVNDGDYWVVAIAVNTGQFVHNASKSFRDGDHAMQRYDAAVALASMNVINNDGHRLDDFEQLLSMDKADEDLQDL